MFYAPWCGHCKKIKPEFDKASSLLAENDPPVQLVKVDCTEAGKDVCQRFEVKGYPTIKIFRDGEFSQDYNGPREYAGIVKFMKSQVGPSSKPIANQAEADALLAKPEVVVMSYSSNEEEEAVFLKVADALRESVQFGHFKSSDKEGIVLHRPKHLQSKMEDSEVVFKGKTTKDLMKKWVEDNYHGIVGHRTIDNGKDFKDPIVIAYFDVDYVKNVKGTNYWRNRIMKIGKEFPKLTFCISNQDDFMQEAMEFGLTAVTADKPRIVIRAEGKKYVMEEDFTMDTFKAFLENYDSGKLESYVKSEALPKDTSAPVKVAVAKNFEELVEKSEKDVLVEFYAPWCGHCKKLTPIWDELGAKMADENVEIVKMDATANDVPSGYDVRGFPTLFWVPASTKKPEAYQGGREVDDFVKFIAANAGEELKSLDRKGNAKKTEL